jgi:tetratricopeptide (TPR) repeat protein
MALALADRAIELEPQSAPGYAARSYVATRLAAPADEVAAACGPALRLEPNNPDGPSWCSRVFAAAGQLDTAFSESERAVALDPQSPGRRLALAYEALAGGRYDVAIRESRVAAALEPELVLPRAIEARALLLSGDAARCTTVRLGPHAVTRATCLHALGRTAEARAIVDSVEAAVASGEPRDLVYTDVTRAEDLAVHYAWTGDAQRALQWVTRSYELSPSGLEVRVLESALFDGVRDDSTFAATVDSIRSGIWDRVRGESATALTW